MPMVLCLETQERASRSAGDILKCIDNDALTCAASGSAYERVACDLGCKSDPAPHCGYLEPRYMPDICDMPATEPPVTFTNVGTLDPNIDSSCTGGVIEQTGAAAICVIRYRTITIASSAKLTISGSWVPAGRAVAFVADGALKVDGMLDVGGKGQLNGPGASLTSNGGPFRIDQSTGTKYGGGGSGGKTNGAPGGSDSTKGGALNGGMLVPDPALLTAFVGGAPGYKLDRDQHPVDNVGGGGGGGALMLISCHDTVSITGTINAGGGGGGGGQDGLGIPFPGGGGGAGGYVVIQAKDIDVSGQLFANGGWGGYGRLANGTQGDDGRNGCLSDTSDTCGGFSAPKNGEGMGGFGGIGASLPTAGDKPTSTSAAPGGGGGSVGFLQTYTPSTTPNLSPAHIAPAFQPNGTVGVR